MCPSRSLENDLERQGIAVVDVLRGAPVPTDLVDLPSTVLQAVVGRRDTPHHPFIVGPDFRMTFGEADERSSYLAGQLLAAGIGKGTRVGLLYPNNAEWAVAWLAIARIGALSVPLSTFATGAELARSLRHTDVHALLMGPTFAGESLTDRLEAGLPELARGGQQVALGRVPYLRWAHAEGPMPPSWSSDLRLPLAPELVQAAESEVGPADTLTVVNTSGATAAPKAVVHTHGSLVRHAALLARRRGLTPDDRIYSPMPFFWVGGLTMVFLAALVSGASAVVQERFEPGEALDLVERERVTQISCWPNASRQMADHPTFGARNLGSVRGGTLVEALPPAYRPPTPDRAPMPLGMTETGGPHTGPDDAYAVVPESLRGTFGRSLPGMEHLIVAPDTGAELPAGEEGLLLLRGLFLMDGFYKRERHETFSAEGWYNTNDLGWFGSDGHLRFTGRRTAMIKTGGSNVSPAEVEAALVQLPGVRTAFVFGVPAAERGDDVAAVVVPLQSDTTELPDLRAQLRVHLSSYKVPRHIKVMAEADLPKLPTGKVDLVGLRGLFSHEQG
jgi:acyl-CoA synthetase (AMP-forming)/AMP-acid ligase II